MCKLNEINNMKKISKSLKLKGDAVEDSMALEKQVMVYELGGEGLPDYLAENGRGVMVVGEIREGDNGKEQPYDRVFDYGFLPKPLLDEIPVEDRLPALNSQAEAQMLAVSRLVADPRKNWGQPATRAEYQGYLEPVYEMLTDRLAEDIGDQLEQAVFLPPLNGGEMPMAVMRQVLAEKYGIHVPIERIARLELKRIELVGTNGEGDRFLVGVRFGHLPEAGEDQLKVFVDDCFATNVSVKTTMLMYGVNGGGFDPWRVVTATGSQRSAESLVRMGMRSEQMIRGTTVYRVGPNGYLYRTMEEGFSSEDYYVGDMGKGTAILPPSFDGVVKCNAERRKLRQEWLMLDYGRENGQRKYWPEMFSREQAVALLMLGVGGGDHWTEEVAGCVVDDRIMGRIFAAAGQINCGREKVLEIMTGQKIVTVD